MSANGYETQQGGCACGHLRYQLEARPMFVHCCHCSWCQRETGSAFAVNALVETSRVTVLEGRTEMIDTPSNSGRGQKIVRCPQCRVAVWSHYAGAGEALSFVRVGTLDEPHRAPPDVHIFTSTKQPWVVLGEDIPIFEEYYSAKALWPPDSLQRAIALKES